ncbi:MAG TPA: peptide-methionine (S)-S-oxide reductase MsrA [Fimbriimonadaceae bacterium]
MVKIALIAAAAIAAVALAVGFKSIPSKPEAPTRMYHGLYLVKGITKVPDHTEKAMFSAGCFWGIELQFRAQKGVVATAVGFTGGTVPNPSYELVCTHTTGHAETVLLEYDPTVVTYKQLLQNFWDMHDPTEGNRQGPDLGDNYRSAIWYFTPEQKAEALASKDALQKSGELKDPITTQISPAGPFYKAEEYHQQYGEKGNVVFCERRKPAAG